MVQTATSGLLYKDKTHRGEKARTYFKSSSHFFCHNYKQSIYRWGCASRTDVIKKHQSQHAVSFDLLQRAACVLSAIWTLAEGTIMVCPWTHVLLLLHIPKCLKRRNSRKHKALDRHEQEGKWISGNSDKCMLWINYMFYYMAFFLFCFFSQVFIFQTYTANALSWEVYPD